MRLFIICNVWRREGKMKASLIKSSAIKVFKDNVGLTIILAFAILAVVIASLIPPQILKYIIDYNLVPKN